MRAGDTRQQRAGVCVRCLRVERGAAKVRESGKHSWSTPMPSDLPTSDWEALSCALQQTIDEWRQAHPTATLNEIERVIDRHLAPCGPSWWNRLLKRVAASTGSSWSQ